MGGVSARGEILAELMLDERAPEYSGRRLVEWAKVCEASGILIPHGVEEALVRALSDYAQSLKLTPYVEQSPRAGDLKVIAGPGGQTHAIRQYRMYRTKPSTSPPSGHSVVARMLNSVLSLNPLDPVIGVRLTLNRSLGGPRHHASLYPDEFFELASIVRTVAARSPHEENPPAPPARSAIDIAVVIRTKNEAAWLPQTLPAVLSQTLLPKEIVIVDNDSTDETREIAEQFRIPVVPISDEQFTFGRALNRGIARTTAPWFVSLSAHCVPVDNRWLEALAWHCADPFVAGVYGRQEPMADSTDFDKRDLWTTFGVEPRLQRGRDDFFHNANALIRREVWTQIPFDESLNGVEDRDWAKKVLADGYVIHYEPAASAYHKHGIHQGRNEARARRVAKVIELIHKREPATPEPVQAVES